MIQKKYYKYVCKNCDHKEQASSVDIIKLHVLNILISIMISLSVVSITLLVIVGPNTLVSTMVSEIMTKDASGYSSELRIYALNITQYTGDDPEQFALELFYNLPNIRYVLNNEFNGMQHDIFYTIEHGGDCKEMSVMYVSLMKSVGHHATVDCELSQSHCVAKIKNKEEYIIVDLTTPSFTVYNNSIDHWDNPFDYNMRLSK